MRIFLNYVFVLFSFNFVAQSELKKDSFFLKQEKNVSNPKEIITQGKEWKFFGEYNMYYNKLTSDYGKPGTIRTFSNVKRNKIITKGDRRVVEKIVYLDSTTLILEFTLPRNIGKLGSPKRKDKKIVNMTFRTIYKR